MESQAEAQAAGIIGPTMPDDSIQDLSDFVGSQPRGFLDTAATAVKLGWDENTESQIADIATASADRLPNPIRLTQQEYHDSEYFRKDVSYPNGAFLSRIKEGAKRHDNLAEKRFLLSQRKPGIWTGIASVGGQIIGQLLSPSTIGAAVATGGVLDGLKAFNVLSKIGETTRAARVAKGIGRGAIEGTVITAPSTLARHAADNEFGVKNTSLDVLENLAEGAAFGGTLRGLGGLFRPITHEAHIQAIKTAVKQIASDKAANVGAIIENGANEELLRQTPVNASGDFLRPNLTEDERNQLEARDQENLSTAETNHTKLKEKQIELEDNEPKKIRKNQSTSALVKRLLDTARIPEDKRTSAQVKFMKRNETHDEAQKTGLEIGSTPHTDEDGLIKGLKDSDELQLLTDRIDRQKGKIDAFNKNLKEKDTTEEDKNVLRRNIDNEEFKRGMAINRRDALNKKKSLSDKVLDGRTKTHEANMLEHDARIKIDEGNTVQEAIDHGIRPITKEGLSSDVSQLESAAGDIDHDPRIQARLDQQVKSTPQTEEESVRIALEDLEADKEAEDYKEVLDGKSANDEKAEELHKDLESVRTCVRSKI